jgi:hypothetical protein
MGDVGAAGRPEIRSRPAGDEERVSERASLSRDDNSRTGPATVSARTMARRWMYCGQLPKLCLTTTVKPAASRRDTIPFARLRCRVPKSMPRIPISSAARIIPAAGSPPAGSARTRSSAGSGESMKPGSPSNRVASGQPAASFTATRI